ncbi:hypothetical protein B9G53_11190 [Pseudanabaena sp. SR411]|uniref:protein phosphatase 2C domain-containing protein n=1 Tax=Pseudanabaena sp. SR411 TaxID=1980935 RepID=UPI000B98E2B3|nr:protein phosphatase 2C domain-containing protein [Pseudanabaena sp. SR411]OYQ64548.1 hypothetical protein B9G53_11190 [Pseudanabaena sp. SR411]
MKPVVSKFTAPKDGNSKTENEDSYTISPEPSRTDGAYCYAVTDGATESSFAREWARELAIAYRKGKLCNKAAFITENLLKIQKNWQQEIDSKESSLPWYALEKAQSGAFSSLIGLKIYKQGTWEAIAVGDSCLFQIRRDQLITKLPIEHSTEFNNRPFLISSLNSKNSQLAQNTKFLENKWEVGDSFYLMSDAIACWFLQQDELGKKPWERIGIAGEDRRQERKMKELFLQNIIDELRENKQIRNDDVTLIIITLES